MQVTIPLTHLAAALEFAAVRDTRYYLNGVYVDPRAGNLVATDGHAAYIGRPGSVTGGGGFTIPRDVCAELVKAGKAAKVKTVTLTPVDGLIEVEALRVAPFKPCEGKFPDWRRVYPTVLTGVAASYNPTLLVKGVKAGKALGVKNAEYNFNFFQNGSDGAVMVLADGEAHAVIMPFRDDTPVSAFQRFEV
jgi:DNA polymerase-3 subunit beta